MSPLHHLREIVREIAAQHQGNASRLKQELGEIETRKAQIETELRTAHRAQEREASYPGQIGMDYACPDCWVRGVQSPMRAIGSNNPREDHFRCNTCDRVTGAMVESW